MAESWPEVEKLFAELVELAREKQTAFLDESCSGKPELRRELESLLAAHGEAGSFLGSFDSAAAAELLDDDDSDRKTIGPYRVLRELGRGGMGVVYLAERADGQFEQQVALKLIKRGMDSDEISRRFLVERQILARLQHPNIARLLDGGVSEAGQPFFAMEFVNGAALMNYCDERTLSIDERLKMLLKIGRAVQYAHQQLVVHRDLKPSNILVTAEGQPMLMDFGIAKLLDTEEAGGGLTRTGMRLVTPEYGSPEQARGDAVTTATDVYALGVILYELLTGQRPYSFPERTPEAMLEVISTVPAIRPSEGAADAALQRSLRGDLDTIVLKALRKEPERRYASVEALLEDIARYRAGLPVTARPDTLGYRSGKFLRRHLIAAIAASLVVAALLTGLSVALWQTRVASQEAAKANEVRAFLEEMFRASDPTRALGEELTARELLERGAARIETDLAEQPEIQIEMMAVLGSLFESLGLYEQSIEMYEKSLEGRRTTNTLMGLGNVVRSSGDLERAEALLHEGLERVRAEHGDKHERTAKALNSLGLLMVEKGEYEAGEALYREALEIRRKLFGEEDEDYVMVLANLAQVTKYKGDYEAAVPLYREAIALRKQLLGENHPSVANVIGNLGVLMAQRGDVEEGEALSLEALEIRRRVLDPEHPDIAMTLNNLAMTYHVKGDFESAATSMREAIALNRKIYGDENRRIATNLHNMAWFLRESGDFEESTAMHEEALAMRRKVLGDEHPAVADTMRHLADVLMLQGQLARAEPLLDEALAIQDEALQPDHPRRASTLFVLGRLRLDQGHAAEAEPLLREGLEIREAQLTEGNWKLAEAHSLLAECLAGLGRTEEAVSMLSAASAILDDEAGASPIARQRAQRVLAGMRD